MKAATLICIALAALTSCAWVRPPDRIDQAIQASIEAELLSDFIP